MQEIREQHQLSTNSRRMVGGRRWLALFILIAGCAGFVTTAVLNSRAAASVAEPQSENLDAIASLFLPPSANGDFSKFAHTEPGHARLPCLLCHRREDDSVRPRLPGHTPCTGCHVQQFADANSPICTICHTNVQTGAVKTFPPLRSFNVVFDHARHTTGLRVACATCHKPVRRGVALSIPARLGAHTTCFQCHKPGASSGERDISSCNTCHHAGGFARTPQWSQAYRVNFSHAKHSAGARLNCSSCHQVRAGAAQRRQVTAPVPQAHNRSLRAQSCLTCHNGQRAFGGYDFLSCRRCHTGGSFRF
ncbi:MAG: hypothetical protein ICV68_02805 [Pyrinomonadaceae bacterium]|nr:hypothetical protein [Pyrinomonadaceae bacterium]